MIISSIIHFFIKQKLSKYIFYGVEHNKLQKTRQLTTQTFIYYLIYSGTWKASCKNKFYLTSWCQIVQKALNWIKMFFFSVNYNFIIFFENILILIFFKKTLPSTTVVIINLRLFLSVKCRKINLFLCLQ